MTGVRSLSRAQSRETPSSAPSPHVPQRFFFSLRPSETGVRGEKFIPSEPRWGETRETPSSAPSPHELLVVLFAYLSFRASGKGEKFIPSLPKERTKPGNSHATILAMEQNGHERRAPIHKVDCRSATYWTVSEERENAFLSCSRIYALSISVRGLL